MNIIMLLLVLIAVSMLYFLITAGLANSWMNDPYNERRLIKHYGGEGIQVWNHEYTKTLEISFHHKGTYYSRSVAYHNAIKWYRQTPNGGIRKLLLKEFE